MTKITDSCGAAILAAGKGTRMHSQSPKVLQELLRAPMLDYVLKSASAVFGERVWTIIGHKAEEVRRVFTGRDSRFVVQAEQLGTGHALRAAWPDLRAAGLERVIIINGDTPALPEATLRAFTEQALAEDCDLAFLTLTLENPGSFGRVLRKNGRVTAIIEAKDYDPSTHGPEPREINAGIYALKASAIEPLLPLLSNANKSGEFYITDLIGLAVEKGLKVAGVNMGADARLLGINTPLELMEAEELLRAAIVESWMKAGVIIRAAASVRIGPDVAIAPGADICGPCELYGNTRLGASTKIESHCCLIDAEVAEGAQVRPFCHIEEAAVGRGCIVGPYARLRPGAVLEEESHVGNFVEMKKARLGKGAKANHLTYLGDADIGAGANIGAGTITCNYDGKNKHRTIIGEGAFIGSNSALVAPVRIGAGALIGAGSVITKTVKDNELAIARGRQISITRRK